MGARCWAGLSLVEKKIRILVQCAQVVKGQRPAIHALELRHMHMNAHRVLYNVLLVFTVIGMNG
jgi:hypothetical protein